MTGQRHASEAGLNAGTCVQSGKQEDDDYYDDEDEEDGTECVMTSTCYEEKQYDDALSC